MQKKNLVIFDVGRTLVNATHVDIIKFFVSKKRLNNPFLLFISLLFLAHKVIGINEKAVCTITTKAFKSFAGMSEDELNRLSREFYEKEFKQKMFSQSIEIIEKHKKNGDEVVLITALLPNVVDCAKKDLGLKYLIAPELEVVDGIVTGKVTSKIPYGINKLILSEALSKKLGLSLDSAYFYSDRYSDLKLFERVEKRIVFNPEAKLRVFAMKEGWKIIDLI